VPADRWNRIEEIFHEAAELPPPEREAFLDRACADDDDLRRDVEALLTADSTGSSQIENAIVEAVGRLPDETPSAVERIERQVHGVTVMWYVTSTVKPVFAIPPNWIT
jgi:eukaryotic-like serine/threonine-protein kinase